MAMAGHQFGLKFGVSLAPAAVQLYTASHKFPHGESVVRVLP